MPDFLPDQETITHWLIHYGSFALFALLAMGIIALPVPEETLLVVTGVMMDHELLAIPLTVLAAYLGSICGITASYLIGRTASRYVITKYGGYVGIKDEHIEQAHIWFERFGKWALFIGYFIPGVRHFTGLLAGMTNLEFTEFALFAYSGAIVWVSTFLSIGYFFGGYWLSIYENIEVSTEAILVAATLLIIAYFTGRFYLKKKNLK